jgi:hypothetical protein
VTDINRIAVPSPPRTTVRKKMPAPFQRPRISVGGGAAQAKREWRVIPVTDVREGDILPGIGYVETVMENVAMPDFDQVAAGAALDPVWTVIVTGGEDNRRVYNGNDEVHVFTAVPASLKPESPAEPRPDRRREGCM